MEVPNRVDFDFLLIVFGIALFFSPFYVSKYMPLPYPFSIFLWILGGAFFYIGFEEMQYNYYFAQTLKELKAAKVINERMKYFEAEKFESKKLLTKKDKKLLYKRIKEYLSQDE